MEYKKEIMKLSKQTIIQANCSTILDSQKVLLSCIIYEVDSLKKQSAKIEQQVKAFSLELKVLEKDNIVKAKQILDHITECKDQLCSIYTKIMQLSEKVTVLKDSCKIT